MPFRKGPRHSGQCGESGFATVAAEINVERIAVKVKKVIFLITSCHPVFEIGVLPAGGALRVHCVEPINSGSQKPEFRIQNVEL
jgi:hypothetical protein